MREMRNQIGEIKKISQDQQKKLIFQKIKDIEEKIKMNQYRMQQENFQKTLLNVS